MSARLISEPYPRGLQIGKWDALLGTLPFLLFGIISMLIKTELPFRGAYTYLNYSFSYLVLYVIALIGLFFGLIKGVPRWTYGYLGWSLVFAWFCMTMPVDALSRSPVKDSQVFGWWSWSPLLIVIGLVILLSRSPRPLWQAAVDIWQDWTRLSLAMYAFIGFLAFVAGYDENHHPYLFAFMTATTLAICVSAWIFMRSTNAWKKSISLVAGTVAAYIIMRVSDATWNWWEYYGYPAPAPEPWYFEVYRMVVIIPILVFIMFWPSLIGLVHKSIENKELSGLVS